VTLPPHLLALAGEDAADEFRVGMAAAAQVTDDGIRAKRRLPLGHGHLVAVILQENPGGAAERARHPGAARVEGADAADVPVGGEVRVAADDDVGAAADEQPRDQALPAATAA
jgi:hypothetical protein